MRLPPWLHDRTAPDGAPGVKVGRRRAWRNALARLVAEMLDNEAIAARRGLLQRVEPRAKVLALLGLIVAATLLHHLSALAATYALCLLLAALSGVPARRVLRIWLAIPLFSAAIMLPALLNIVTPGRDLLTLWHFADTRLGPWTLPPTLTVTDAGLYITGRFILRTAVCVTLALLLTTTTPADRLLRGLRGLGVPLLFVMLLGMMQRYLAVFVRAAEEIHLAKISRSLAAASVRHEQAWVAAGIGALFRRTHALGNAVYLAMLSRGYTGAPRLLDEPRWRARDWLFLAAMLGIMTAIWFL